MATQVNPNQTYSVPHATIPAPRSAVDATAPLELEVVYTADSTAVLNVRGDVDTCTVHRLRELLHSRLRSELTTLVLDLSGVGFISIEATQMLARAAIFARYHRTRLRIVPGRSVAVRRALTATALGGELPLDED